MVRFRDRLQLPHGYGLRFDERVVEYPWVLSHLSTSTGRLLDAGSTLNNELCLRDPRVARKDLTIVTLAPESDCFWFLGVSYDFEDLRRLPYRDEIFDEITCISTLEHVGMDNTIYGVPGRDDLGDHRLAARELMRVLKPDGRALITVPYGRSTDMGFQRQFGHDELTHLLEALTPRSAIEATFFRYTRDGWALSEEAECRDASYFDVRARGLGRGRVSYDDDWAAAARAVACLEVRKS